MWSWDSGLLDGPPVSPKQYPPLEWGLCRVSAGHREHPTLPADCSKPAEHLLEENYPEHWNYPVLSCSEQWERLSSWAKCQSKHKITAKPPKGMPEWRVQTEAWTSLWNLLPKIKMLKCRGKKITAKKFFGVLTFSFRSRTKLFSVRISLYGQD